MCTIQLLIAFALLVHSSSQIDRLYENDICHNEDGVRSFCKRLDKCTTGVLAIKAGKPPKICSFAGNLPIVCCPPIQQYETTEKTPDPWERPGGGTTRPSGNQWAQGGFPASTGLTPEARKAKEMCAQYAKSVVITEPSPILSEGPEIMETIDFCARVDEPLIVGGVVSRPREYPHMTLIGYGKQSSTADWLCGGSLISDRFVLSAAHCSNPGRKGPATWAKIGELDTSTDTDDAQPIIYRIIQRIDHPKYSSVTLYNDLSLFKLDRSVEFGAYIRPICLPTQIRPDLKKAVATGWGHTSWGGHGSSALMKVELNVVTTRKCNETYRGSIGRQIPRGILGDSMLCAGDEEGKDTCQGDSGGPLQIALKDPYCMYELIGLTSFGKTCGNAYPGVYTRISYFLPWIVKNVWP